MDKEEVIRRARQYYADTELVEAEINRLQAEFKFLLMVCEEEGYDDLL